jgi:peroxiredoxin (alkyl hydroperoxide reductase subunit C)
MLTVGDKFPNFELEACVSREHGKEFSTISLDTVLQDGKWLVFFFWPKDFTFVCPTEIYEFDKKYEDFEALDTVLLGASTDTAFVHLAWRNNHPDLKDLRFAMISDHAKKLTSALGILTGADQVALRATFIVDPDGIIQWVNVNDLNVGRSTEETLRVLEALQTGELVPCNWHRGDAVLKV